MNRPKPRLTLAENLHALMRRHELTQTALAKRAGVSQRTVSNLLDPEKHSPTLESVDAVAAAFGLEGWHLIMPSLMDDLNGETSIAAMVKAYNESSPDGKRHILRVAEREAEYKATQDPAA